MVERFVAGVRDSQAERGFVEVPAGEVVAIDLGKGTVLWRRERIGRPIAATRQRLLTLDRAGDRLVLRLFDVVSGADAGTIDDLGMPAWAGRTDLAPDAVQVETAEVPDGVRLQWTVRHPYRGGAPPPPHIEAEAQREAHGAVIVDPTTLRVTPTAPTPAAAQDITRAREGSTDPTVLASERVGDTVFALKASGPGITLQARDGRGTVLWELPLSSQQSRRPTPQRM
jgi:hypothetical protein